MNKYRTINLCIAALTLTMPITYILGTTTAYYSMQPHAYEQDIDNVKTVLEAHPAGLQMREIAEKTNTTYLQAEYLTTQIYFVNGYPVKCNDKIVPQQYCFN